MSNLGIPILFDGYEAGTMGWSFHIVQNEMIKSLNRLGEDVYIENCSDAAESLIQQIGSKVPRYDGIGIRISTEDEIDLGRSRIKTCFFYSAETEVKRVHVEKLNDLSAVFVASENGKKLLRANGVGVPIHLWPHGYDPEVYKPHPRTADGGTIRYLFVGQNWKRKGLDILLDAWEDFILDKDANLTLKMNPLQGTDKEWLDKRGVPRRVDIRWEMYHDPKDLVNFHYATHDIFVLPTRSEGFGMPVVEAAACGLKLIVTEASSCGYMDFVDSIPHYKVKSDGLVSRDDGYCIGDWESPSRESLLECLEESYRAHQKCEVGEIRYVPEEVEKWTWDKITESKILPVLGGLLG